MRSPWLVVGGTVIGGIVGGAFGYQLFSGMFEQLYDVYILE